MPAIIFIATPLNKTQQKQLHFSKEMQKQQQQNFIFVAYLLLLPTHLQLHPNEYYRFKFISLFCANIRASKLQMCIYTYGQTHTHSPTNMPALESHVKLMRLHG